MRMPWYKELKWLLAAKLFYWSLLLVQHEATKEMLTAYGDLADSFRNATKHNTIPMRRKITD